MKLYNYDYDDMMELTMSLNTNEETQILSKIYPTKLEVKIDEYENRPYLYYEGIVRTNMGFFKIVLPKLDLVLGAISYERLQNWDQTINPWRLKSDYKITTEFYNANDENPIFYLQCLSADEHKDVIERLWNGVKIVGENTNSED